MRVEGQVATRALVEFAEVAEVAFASVEDSPKDVFGAAGVDALAFCQVVEPARAHHREAFHLSLCEAQAHPERHARWCVGMGSPVNLLLKLLHGRHGGCRSMQKARRQRADAVCVCLSLASKKRPKKESSETANRNQRQLCNETSFQSIITTFFLHAHTLRISDQSSCIIRSRSRRGAQSATHRSRFSRSSVKCTCELLRHRHTVERLSEHVSTEGIPKVVTKCRETSEKRASPFCAASSSSTIRVRGWQRSSARSCRHGCHP